MHNIHFFLSVFLAKLQEIVHMGVTRFPCYNTPTFCVPNIINSWPLFRMEPGISTRNLLYGVRSRIKNFKNPNPRYLLYWVLLHSLWNMGRQIIYRRIRKRICVWIWWSPSSILSQACLANIVWLFIEILLKRTIQSCNNRPKNVEIS